MLIDKLSTIISYKDGESEAIKGFKKQWNCFDILSIGHPIPLCVTTNIGMIIIRLYDLN